jgi:type IX secretion system PorP/SprF family membrane protein
MRNLIKLILVLFVIPVSLNGQDPHWSMLQWNPVYLNPAFSGFAGKANRLTGIYRDQWRSASVPYSTSHFSYDRRVVFNEEKGIRFGLGAQFHYDKAGDGALSAFRPGISAAFGKYFNQNKQLLHIGVNAAYVVKQLDFDKLSFDTQFDGFQYDPNLSTQEQISDNSAGYFDLGAGLNFRSELKKMGNIDVGVSAFNLTQPNLSFLSAEASEISPRITAYTRADIFLGKSSWEFNPGVFYQHQYKAQETVIQTLFSVKFGDNDTEGNNYKLTFGPGYRWDDAVIGSVGLGWNDLRVAFAFDGNVSDFKTASGGRGAYELMVNYEFEKKKRKPDYVIDTIMVEPEPEVEDEEQLQDTLEEVPVAEEVEVVEEEVIPDPVAALMKQVEQYTRELNDMAAIQLFFDNNQPDPGSFSSTTTATYDELVSGFFSQRQAYQGQWGDEANAFFETGVKAGINTLDQTLGKILLVLEQGKKVSVDIKGFSSPLASDKYNKVLSERRISSLENYFAAWSSAALQPYIDKGTLVLNRVPMGESAAAPGVSDNARDTRNSVFSPAASYERRVEISDIIVE